jgi:DNA-binding MarR family transcriptional regulator
MLSIIKKITSFDSKKLTTAHVGVLQAYAYRALKAQTDECLEVYDIKSSEWAVLGLLHAQKEGMKPHEVAHILGVKKPYITAMMTKLQKKNLIAVERDEEDGRERNLFLTAKGEEIVPEIEKTLRKSMKGLVKGVNPRDLMG